MKYTQESILELFKDDNFIFEPVEHIYTYNGRQIPSVSSFLDRFKKPFDYKWADIKAKENGVTVDEILKEWNDAKIKGCEIGHIVHDYIENDCKGKSNNIIIDKEILPRIEQYHQLKKTYLKDLKWLGAEIRMFDIGLNICGTTDALFYDENGDIILMDWKTNKKFTTDSNTRFNKMSWPFHDEYENKLNIYSIQLSMYRLMLERKGVNIKKCVLIHIGPNGETNIHNAKDYRSNIMEYFTCFAKGK